VNKSDNFFSKLLKDRAKAVKDKKFTLVDKINDDIKNKFVSLYVNEGYDMLIQDCARLLDVEEKWLVRTFGNEFDYVLAPSPATKVFTKLEILNYPDLSTKLGYIEMMGLENKELRNYNSNWLMQSRDIRTGLARKRIFVNRESFYRFMDKNLRVINEFKRVVVQREKLHNLSNSQLDKIKDEVFATFNLGKLDERGKFKFYEQNNLVNRTCVEMILKEKLFSGKSIKEQYISLNTDSSLVTKVYDTQLYRWLDRMDVTKITLKPANNTAPVDRFLFPFSLREQLEEIRGNEEFFKENYVFNIPSYRNTEEVVEHLIFYVDFLYTEQKINMDDSCSDE